MPLRGLLIGLIAIIGACSEVPRANLPGESPPPSAPPPAMTVAAAPSTAAPTPEPSPTPRRTFALGEKIAYQDGWQLTVLKIEEHLGSRFTTPSPGSRFVAVFVRFDNGSRVAVHANPFYFKLQDSTGIRRQVSFMASRTDSLSASDVAPGAFVVGTVVFEVPATDKQLQLIYEQIGYTQTTVDLQ